MLGKLIKNDFIATAHSMLGIYGATFVVAVAAAFSYAFNSPAFIQAVITLILLVLSFAILIIPIFQLLSYFNKSLYSNQGYLSYTLPVTSENLLLSKAIVSFSWIVLSYASYIAIYAFIIKYFFGKIDPEILAMFEEIYAMFNGPEKAALFKGLAVILALVLLEIIILVSQIFFSITLSNIKPFSYLGGIAGIATFIAIFIAMFSIALELTQKIPLSLKITGGKIDLVYFPMVGTDPGEGMLIGIAGLIFQFVAMLIMFAGTDYLMKKKINIK